MSLHRWRSNVVFALFMILSFSIAAQALPISEPSDTDHKNEHLNWGCSFSGNSDLYGLGIRVGVYLQLLSTLLANALLSEELREDARNTNAIIMIAIFAGMVNATIKTQMNAIEIFVMSTLLMSFLWSDFTPSHISSLVLFSHSKKKPTHDKKVSKQAISLPTISSSSPSNQLSQQGLAATEAESKPYFAAVSRSVFGTAIAIFNLWFWLYSRHTLLKNGIDDPACIPIVFLQTQIALGNNQALFYVIVSVAYAAYEVLFMGWWLYVLTPGTLRLFWELSVMSMASIFHCQHEKADISVQAKVAKWYLEFARLDQSALKIFPWLRLSLVNQERVRKLRLYVPSIVSNLYCIVCMTAPSADQHSFVMWFGFPAGYTVIMWVCLAIELTLGWNAVTGVYVLGSTGQLIPFVVGVLGLVRNLHLIAVKLSERAHARNGHQRKLEGDIRVEWDTGTYVYGLGMENELRLEARSLTRRWSVHSGLMELGEERRSGRGVA